MSSLVFIEKIGVLRRFLLLLLMLACVNVATGVQQSTVTGRVTDSGSAPIPTASVKIISVARPLLLIPEPVHPDGTFSVTFDKPQNQLLRCEISAPGFVPETRNFELSQSPQSLGTIVLKAASGLKIDIAERITSGTGGEVNLDFFLANEADESAEVRAIHITGTAQAQTSCLDFTPALNLDITRLFPGGKLTTVAIHDNQTRQTDKVLAKGGAELLPCHQCRIDLSVPILFELAGHEKRKIRIVLPRKINDKSRYCLPLEDWAAMGIHILTSSGEITAAVK